MFLRNLIVTLFLLLFCHLNLSHVNAFSDSYQNSLGSPSQSVDTTCIYKFLDLQKGISNITVPNYARGQAVLIVAGSDVRNPHGHILFFLNRNYSVWWTQTPGNQSYSVSSSGGLAGYLSCYLGHSMKLLKFAQGENVYHLFTQNYTTLFVIIGCYDLLDSCDNTSVQNGTLERIAFGQSHALVFYYGLINSTGSYITVVVPNGYSFVFLIGVSHKSLGWIRGLIEPKNAIVLVNGTRYLIKNGVLNLSLPYGIYNVTFLAKGYSNLSIIVPVYGGEVTPLNVELAKLQNRFIFVISLAMRYYLPVLIIASAIAIGVYSLRRMLD